MTMARPMRAARLPPMMNVHLIMMLSVVKKSWRRGCRGRVRASGAQRHRPGPRGRAGPRRARRRPPRRVGPGARFLHALASLREAQLQTPPVVGRALANDVAAGLEPVDVE